MNYPSFISFIVSQTLQQPKKPFRASLKKLYVSGAPRKLETARSLRTSWKITWLQTLQCSISALSVTIFESFVWGRLVTRLFLIYAGSALVRWISFIPWRVSRLPWSHTWTGSLIGFRARTRFLFCRSGFLVRDWNLQLTINKKANFTK